MTQPTKPSAGALRAATEALRYVGMIHWTKDNRHIALAHIIDRETGVAGLLEAAKAVLTAKTSDAHHHASVRLEEAIAKVANENL